MHVKLCGLQTCRKMEINVRIPTKMNGDGQEVLHLEENMMLLDQVKHI